MYKNIIQFYFTSYDVHDHHPFFHEPHDVLYHDLFCVRLIDGDYLSDRVCDYRCRACSYEDEIIHDLRLHELLLCQTF